MQLNPYPHSVPTTIWRWECLIWNPRSRLNGNGIRTMNLRYSKLDSHTWPPMCTICMANCLFKKRRKNGDFIGIVVVVVVGSHWYTFPLPGIFFMPRASCPLFLQTDGAQCSWCCGMILQAMVEPSYRCQRPKCILKWLLVVSDYTLLFSQCGVSFVVTYCYDVLPRVSFLTHIT